MKQSIASVIAALVLSFPMVGQSAPLTFLFEGEVTSTFFDPFDPFGGTIGVGTTFSGSYTFESTTPDAIPDPSVGSYSNFGLPFGMSVEIGAVVFTAREFLNIGVANDIGAGVDQYTVLAQQGTPFVDPDALSMEIFLEDPAGAALADDSLPLTPPDLLQFSTRDFFLDGTREVGFDIFQFQIQGTLTALTAVPEPAASLLVGAGLLALGWRSRRAIRGRWSEEHSGVGLRVGV